MNKTLKEYIKQILIERRNISPNEMAALKDLTKEIVIFYNDGNERRVKKAIYEFITEDHEFSKITKNQYQDDFGTSGSGNEKFKKYIDFWKNNLAPAITETGKRRGWTYDHGGAWLQWNKPAKEKKGDNYKIYVTFNKNENKFFENCKKIPTLLANLNEIQTTSNLSFKISSNFYASFMHKDNIVIHFSDNTISQDVQNAVKKTGFDTVDRESIGRTDLGKDTSSTSDSDNVASEVVKIISKIKDKLLKYISADENSTEFKQGMGVIFDIVEKEMKEASHRK